MENINASPPPNAGHKYRRHPSTPCHFRSLQRLYVFYDPHHRKPPTPATRGFAPIGFGSSWSDRQLSWLDLTSLGSTLHWPGGRKDTHENSVLRMSTLGAVFSTAGHGILAPDCDFLSRFTPNPRVFHCVLAPFGAVLHAVSP